MAQDFAYDHPQYTVAHLYSGSTTAGANGTSTKFAAHVATKLKSITFAPNIVSTSASQPVLYYKSGTTTSTATLSAITSAATSVKTNTLNITLAQGDQFYVAHGTDATLSLSVSIEGYVTPGQSLNP